MSTDFHGGGKAKNITTLPGALLKLKLSHIYNLIDLVWRHAFLYVHNNTPSREDLGATRKIPNLLSDVFFLFQSNCGL